jgi:mannose-6-phosphate isomerase
MTWADDIIGRRRVGRTLLLPAALGHAEITGPAHVLLGYLPDLARDIDQPLTAAGYGPAVGPAP